MNNPKVGNIIECLGDVGNVTNSPWTGTILKIEKVDHYRVSTDNGEFLYYIPNKCLMDSWVGKKSGKTYFSVG